MPLIKQLRLKKLLPRVKIEVDLGEAEAERDEQNRDDEFNKDDFVTPLVNLKSFLKKCDRVTAAKARSSIFRKGRRFNVFLDGMRPRLSFFLGSTLRHLEVDILKRSLLNRIALHLMQLFLSVELLEKVCIVCLD